MTVSSATTTPTEFIRFAEELADASRALIRSRFRRNADVEMKPDNTPVTPTDLEVETLIRGMIADRYPAHGIIGEEHPASAASAECVWVIDPIDGTRSFIAGRPVFGTLIALTVDTVPVLGVVDIPITQERWVGAKGHAGTLPMADRRDALLAFARVAAALEREVGGRDAAVKFTIGRLDAYPNAPSVVPEKVVFRVDLRHPDNGVLEGCGERLRQLCGQHAPPCIVSATELVSAPSNGFDPALQRAIDAAAERRRLSAMAMISFAGHDARQMARLCPSAMIFIPCRDGISHDENEWAEPAHVAAGAQVLLDVVTDLADVWRV